MRYLNVRFESSIEIFLFISHFMHISIVFSSSKFEHDRFEWQLKNHSQNPFCTFTGKKNRFLFGEWFLKTSTCGLVLYMVMKVFKKNFGKENILKVNQINVILLKKYYWNIFKCIKFCLKLLMILFWNVNSIFSSLIHCCKK